MPASAPTPEPSPEPLSLQQGLDQLDVATIDLADLPIFPDLDALQIGGFTMPTHLVGPPAASLDSVPATSAAR